MGGVVLSAEETRTYHRDGFIVLPAVFDADEVAEMADEADRLTDLLLNASLALDEASPRLDLRERPEGRVLLKIQPLNDVSPVLARISADDRLLEPMRDLLGCEPLLLEEKLNGKELLAPAADALPARSDADEFPFHTDFHYFWLDGYPRQTLSSAVTIDDCTTEKGPLVMARGSHTTDWPTAQDWPPYLRDGLFADEDLVELVVPAGSVVIFHSCLAHSSRPNRTNEPRRLMIYSHYPSTHVVAPDARNRTLREAGQAHEARYVDALAAGYQPVPVRLSAAAATMLQVAD